MNNNIIAKVTAFEENKREKPHYKAEAHQNEKEKGIGMISYLKNLFGVGSSDERKFERQEQIRQRRENSKEIEEKRKIRWTRDEKGNIQSPFFKPKEMKDKS